MKLVRTVYKYLVDNIGSPLDKLFISREKKLYRLASNDNVSSISSINYYNYSLFVMVVRHSDDEGKLGSIMIDNFRWYKERADRGSHSACWRKLKFVRNISLNSRKWQADLFINPSQFGDSKFISSAVFE